MVSKRDPAVPASAGQATLGVSMVDGLSVVTTCFATSPVKLLTPRARGTSVWAYASSYGGGIVAGDQARLEVQMGAGARGFLGTQSSTKIYRNPRSLCSSLRTSVRISAGGLFVLAPDATQLFAGSSYEQTQRFELDPAASLVLVDWFSAGRLARGERWEFSRYSSRNEIRVNNEIRIVESTRLTPSEPGSGFLSTAYNAMASMVFIGPLLEECSQLVLEDVQSRPVLRNGSVVVSASPVSGGLVLRAASISAELLASELHRFLKPVFALLDGDPWSCKG